MAQAANIVINDGQTTPVAHTFYYVPLAGNVASFEDRAGGIYIGYNQIKLSINRPAPNRSAKTVANQHINVHITVATPKMETLGTGDNGLMPPPTVSYRPICDIKFALPERCNVADRKDLLAYVRNLLSNAQIVSAVQDYELPW